MLIALVTVFIMCMPVQSMAADAADREDTEAVLRTEVTGTPESTLAAFKNNPVHVTSNWPIDQATRTDYYLQDEVIGTPESAAAAFRHNQVHVTSNWPAAVDDRG